MAKKDFHVNSLLLGVAAAVILYLLFWLGYTISQWLFSFAQGQVHSIYQIRAEGRPLLIALVLLFITSPAEEIFGVGLSKNGPWAGMVN